MNQIDYKGIFILEKSKLCFIFSSITNISPTSLFIQVTFILFLAVALISIYTKDHLEHLTFGHNCEIVDYQPRPGADINGDEEYERY